MSGPWFNEHVKPNLKGYLLECSSFFNGDFGDLERIELEGFNMLGTVEFWSKGWVGIDVYDCTLGNQLMNVLLSPEERDSLPKIFEIFVEILVWRN